MALTGYGLFVLYSASGQDFEYVQRQAIRVGVGLVAMLIISQVPPYVLRIWTPWFYGIGILLVASTWIFGVGRGAQRWLDIGFIRFQPSELMTAPAKNHYQSHGLH